MRDDQELKFAAGEMSDVELLAFEQSLTPEIQEFKSVFSSLKLLSQGIPEPQISFDRVRHAIENSPSSPIPHWTSWLAWATPIAVMGALAIVMMRPAAPTSLGQVEQPKAVAQATEPELHRTPTMESTSPRVIAPTPAKTTNGATAQTESRSNRRLRRHARAVLVAQNREEFRRPSEGLPKAAPTPTNSANTVQLAPAPVEAVEPAQPQESVVVVSSTPNEQTGANAATEVTKQTDDVLGG